MMPSGVDNVRFEPASPSSSIAVAVTVGAGRANAHRVHA